MSRQSLDINMSRATS